MDIYLHKVTTFYIIIIIIYIGLCVGNLFRCRLVVTHRDR
jgi:hypothetical protein